MATVKVTGTSVIIDGKYYIREVIRGKETLHSTQWTVEDMRKAKAKLSFLVWGTKMVIAGEMDRQEFFERFIAMP